LTARLSKGSARTMRKGRYNYELMLLPPDGKKEADALKYRALGAAFLKSMSPQVKELVYNKSSVPKRCAAAVMRRKEWLCR